MDVFVDECMKSLAYQELEISRFILSLNSEHFNTDNNMKKSPHEVKKLYSYPILLLLFLVILYNFR